MISKSLWGISASLILVFGNLKADEITSSKELHQESIERIDPALELKKALWDLSFDLIIQLDTEKKNLDDNVMFSPLVLDHSLNQTMIAADNKVLQPYLDILGLDDSTYKNIFLPQLKNQIRTLNQSQEDYKLSLKNFFWWNTDRSEVVRQDFTSSIEDVFQTQFSEVSFSTPATMGILNDEIAQATDGKIDEFFGQEDLSNPLLVWLSVSTMNLKAKWIPSFVKSTFSKINFKSPSGNTHELEAIWGEGGEGAKYISDFNFEDYEATWEALRIPLGITDKKSQTSEVKAYAFFYKPIEISMQTMINQVKGTSREERDTTFNNGNGSCGSIMLPALKTNIKTDLKNALKTLGMSLAFDESYNGFPEMVTPETHKTPLSLFNALQQVQLEFTEWGLEAGVAGLVYGGGPPSCPSYSFNLDSPFLFVIEDAQTKAILTMGVINNPDFEK